MEIAGDLRVDFFEYFKLTFLIYVQFTFLWSHSKWHFGEPI